MLNSLEIQEVIREFYRKEQPYFAYAGVDELLACPSSSDNGYLALLVKLREHLAHKERVKGLDGPERALFGILSRDSGQGERFLPEFKQVLQSMETI